MSIGPQRGPSGVAAIEAQWKQVRAELREHERQPFPMQEADACGLRVWKVGNVYQAETPDGFCLIWDRNVEIIRAYLLGYAEGLRA